jgi:hypothetical protein
VKFFTIARWSGEDESNDAPMNAYADHLAQIGDRLPPDLLATQQSISLHDSRLRKLHLSVESGSLRIVLENYDGDPPLTLLYSQVSRFESVTSSNRLSGPAGDGDETTGTKPVLRL